MSNPKKENGTTRALGVPNKDVSKGAEAYRRETLRSNFNPKLSAFFQKSGGYVAWLAGHQHPEQGRANPEYDFARYLAKKGHYIELLPEREGYEDAISLNEVGQNRKFVDASATSSVKKHTTSNGLLQVVIKIMVYYKDCNMLLKRIVVYYALMITKAFFQRNL